MTSLIGSVEDGGVDTDICLIEWGEVALTQELDVARAELERFRGQVLSKAYALERQLDALITWHLFRLRFDGSAGFFTDYILKDGAFGLNLKVKLTSLIMKSWAEDEAEATVMIARLKSAKLWRDRVAHWEIRLRSVHRPDGRCVGYSPRITKGDEEHSLTPLDRQRSLDVVAQAEVDAKQLCKRIFELSRDMPAD